VLRVLMIEVSKVLRRHEKVKLFFENDAKVLRLSHRTTLDAL